MILSHLQMNWNKWERLHRQRVSYQLTPGHKTGSDRTACSGHTTQTERNDSELTSCVSKRNRPNSSSFSLNISEQRFRLLEFAPICFDKKNRDPSRITKPPWVPHVRPQLPSAASLRGSRTSGCIPMPSGNQRGLRVGGPSGWWDAAAYGTTEYN